MALARRSRESLLCGGIHSSHVAPRSCTEGGRPPAGAVPFHVTYTNHNQRDTARAAAASLRVLQPPERQQAQWGVRACHANASCALEVTARTSQHDLAPRKREASRRRSALPHRVGRSHPAWHGARAASSHVSQPPETQPAQWRLRVGHEKACCAVEFTARTSHHGLARKEEGLPPVQCPCMSLKQTTTSATPRARAASLRVLKPPERQQAQWGVRACHADAGCALEVTARTSHHGLAPKERDLPPAQCPFYSAGGDHRQRGTACARQARVFRPIPRHSQRSGACASVVTRKPAVCWRAQLARRTTVLRRRREAFRRCSVISGRVKRSHPARHGVRTRHARVFRHLPRDNRRSGACASVTRQPAVRCWRPHLACRTTVLRRRREASCRCSTLSYRTDRPQPARHVARTRKFACFAISRETASAVALERVPRECRLHVGGNSSYVAPRSCTERERPLAGVVHFHIA